MRETRHPTAWLPVITVYLPARAREGIVHPASVDVPAQHLQDRVQQASPLSAGATGIHPAGVFARWVSDPSRAGPGLRSVLDMAGVALVAGSVSTVLFAVSTLPMLIKAARTKELDSYSRGNLVLANVGNAVHSIYVLQLPAGPIWALHSFYVVTSGLMLIWHFRYASRAPRSDGAPSSTGGFHDDRTRRDSNHRSRPGRPSHCIPPAAGRTFLPDPGQQRQSRRQLARPVGVPAPLLACTVRRTAGPAVPESAMVLSHQGRGRRLPVDIRKTVQTPRAHTQQSRPAPRRGWEVRAAARG